MQVCCIKKYQCLHACRNREREEKGCSPVWYATLYRGKGWRRLQAEFHAFNCLFGLGVWFIMFFMLSFLLSTLLFFRHPFAAQGKLKFGRAMAVHWTIMSAATNVDYIYRAQVGLFLPGIILARTTFWKYRHVCFPIHIIERPILRSSVKFSYGHFQRCLFL